MTRRSRPGCRWTLSAAFPWPWPSGARCENHTQAAVGTDGKRRRAGRTGVGAKREVGRVGADQCHGVDRHWRRADVEESDRLGCAGCPDRLVGEGEARLVEPDQRRRTLRWSGAHGRRGATRNAVAVFIDGRLGQRKRIPPEPHPAELAARQPAGAQDAVHVGRIQPGVRRRPVDGARCVVHQRAICTGPASPQQALAVEVEQVAVGDQPALGCCHGQGLPERILGGVQAGYADNSQQDDIHQHGSQEFATEGQLHGDRVEPWMRRAEYLLPNGAASAAVLNSGSELPLRRPEPPPYLFQASRRTCISVTPKHTLMSDPAGD